MSEPDEPIGRRAYAGFADRYDAFAPTKPYNALHERPATLSLLGDVAGLRVLDAGCGSGICSEILARRGAAVHGVDVTPEMLELARRRCAGLAVELTLGDLMQPLHWLAEHVLDWSGLPVIHVRPTTFLDNPLFTVLSKRSVRERGVLALPFGTGSTSPITADDVARVVAALLRDPAGRIGRVFELTGPEVLDINGLAEQYSRALNRPITAEDVPLDQWERQVLDPVGLPDHVRQHIATMARLHRDGRYDRATDDVEQITGQPARTVERHVAANPDLFY